MGPQNGVAGPPLGTMGHSMGSMGSMGATGPSMYGGMDDANLMAQTLQNISTLLQHMSLNGQNTSAQQQSSSSSMEVDKEPLVVSAGHRKYVKEEFQALPSDLKRMLHQHERIFSKRVDNMLSCKDMKAKYDELDRKKSMHVVALKTKQKCWQVHEDVMKHGNDYNPALEWERLMESHAQAEWTFIKSYNSRALFIFEKLTSLHDVGTQFEK
eukprot:12398085-Karenia_brevis.AAC.1